MEFWANVLSQTFLVNALCGGILASIACGIIGPFVVVKRIGSAAGGIAHSILGGMGVAFYFGYDPIAGALVAALIAAAMITVFSVLLDEYKDVMINALWSAGMAIGIIFIAKSPGYTPDLNSYLFGNILLVGRTQLIWAAVLTAVIAGTILPFYRMFLSVSFDAEFSKLRNIPVIWFELLMYVLVAIAVVVLMQIVGLIMVIALLTLPAASSLSHSKSVLNMMFASTIFGAFSTVTGLWTSYQFDLPSGPSIILIATVVFAAILSFHTLRRRLILKGS